MKIYKRDITENENFSQLPDVLTERINSFLNKKRQNASAAGYLLLKEALSENGRNINNISFLETGKPIMPDCYISVSHSADLAVCAVSRKPIGIDAEKKRNVEKREKYRFFTQSENKYVNNGQNPDLNFLVIWTMKEAYKKVTGCDWGELSGVNFAEEDGRLCEKRAGYRFETECFGEYVITVCEQESDL